MNVNQVFRHFNWKIYEKLSPFFSKISALVVVLMLGL